MLVTFQSNKYDVLSFDSVSCFGLVDSLNLRCQRVLGVVQQDYTTQPLKLLENGTASVGDFVRICPSLLGLSFLVNRIYGD